MKRKFWLWVHDRLESAWHWVYRTKLAKPIPGEQKFRCGSGEMGTLYWSKGAVLSEYPKMEPLGVDYYRVNPDGSFTLLDGPTDTAVIR
jgi:hypothetical protein